MANKETSVKKEKAIVRNGRILNCAPSRETENDWRFEHAVGAGHVTEDALRSIPDSVDLREAWWDIGDQRETGACVGFAIADSLMRYQFVKARRLAKNNKLSVRFIWMAAKEMDEDESYPSTFLEWDTTTLKGGLDIARNYGCVEDLVLPFEPEKLYSGEPETFLAKASRYKILNYFNLFELETEIPDWDKVRTWIATKGPVLVRLILDDTWASLDQKTNPGKYNLDEYHKPKPNESAGHAIALVGYTSDGFIVRNSYGKGWGDEGYGYASLQYAQDAFKEAYGITILP
jgi:hypothetical protein